MAVRGYPIAAEAIDQELYRLLCLIAASGAIYEERGTAPALDQLRRTFEQSEVSLRLISVAVTLRNLLDTSQIGPAHDWLPVGKLWRTTGEQRVEADLSFREACNKIIHADDVELYDGAAHELPALANRIRLFGSRGPESWVAELDSYEFIKVAFEFA